jgi:hypothetical protein
MLEIPLAEKTTNRRQNSNTSPLHIKRRNQEGSHAARCQLLTCLWEATRWAKQHAVLPQRTLGQISIAPWTNLPHPRKKEKKTNWMINKQQKKKRHVAKRAGCPELRRVGVVGHSLTWTVHEQAGRRRLEWQLPPSNLGVGIAWNSGCRVESSTRVGDALPQMNCK